VSRSELSKKLILSVESAFQLNLNSNEIKKYLIDYILKNECELGFSHGDFLLRNIMESTDSMFVLDWEFFGQRLKGYDLAMLWVQLFKKPTLQQYVYEKIQRREDWKTLDIIIITLLAKEIRIHKEDEQLIETYLLSELLREFLDTLTSRWAT